MSSEHAGAVSPPAVQNGIELLRRLEDLSKRALEAVEELDLDSLQRILQERAKIIERADRVLAKAREEERVLAGPTVQRAVAGGARALLEAALQLQTHDKALLLALASSRDTIAQDLSALENGGAARSAYGPKQRGRGAIDLVR